MNELLLTRLLDLYGSKSDTGAGLYGKISKLSNLGILKGIYNGGSSFTPTLSSGMISIYRVAQNSTISGSGYWIFDMFGNYQYVESSMTIPKGIYFFLAGN